MPRGLRGLYGLERAALPGFHASSNNARTAGCADAPTVADRRHPLRSVPRIRLSARCRVCDSRWDASDCEQAQGQP